MNFNIDIYADGADLNNIKTLNQLDHIKGFTTNPTLMKKSGVTNYESFAKEFLNIVKEKPISFEVFADDLNEMYSQAIKINEWGKNVYVKIPITNTKSHSCVELIKELNQKRIKCNVTAVFTYDQIKEIIEDKTLEEDLIISVFAGRIADTGLDPIPLMKYFSEKMNSKSNFKLLWASPREILNIFHAETSGCDIITVPHDLLDKLHLIGKNLDDFSLDTVNMFYKDALNSKFSI